MISSILGVVGGLLKVWGLWMEQKANPKVIAAAQQKDSVKDDDEFKKALKEKDIEKTRTDLADS